jgi:ribosomal protein S27AE
MKSLEEHNKDQTERYNNTYAYQCTNIACPKCGQELVYTDPEILLTSIPPKKRVNCPNCGHIDFAVI